MKDHEIIAILEGCDDAQRERVLAWAKARWGAEACPAPALTRPAPPIVPPLDPMIIEQERAREETMRRLIERHQPPHPRPWEWEPPGTVPWRRTVHPDLGPPDTIYPFWSSCEATPFGLGFSIAHDDGVS